MIIGNGLLAQNLACINNDKTVFIASGVSDSTCKDPIAFQRERDLLRSIANKYQDWHIVYFSTTSIFDKSKNDSPYVIHKLEAEKFLTHQFSNVSIIRASNIVGRGGNPNTLFNYFFDRINRVENFSVWTKSYRNLVGIDDFVKLVGDVLTKRADQEAIQTYNVICERNFEAIEIVKAIEIFLNKKALFVPIEKESYSDFIDAEAIQRFKNVISTSENYLEKLLTLYYK